MTSDLPSTWIWMDLWFGMLATIQTRRACKSVGWWHYPPWWRWEEMIFCFLPGSDNQLTSSHIEDHGWIRAGAGVVEPDHRLFHICHEKKKKQRLFITILMINDYQNVCTKQDHFSILESKRKINKPTRKSQMNWLVLTTRHGAARIVKRRGRCEWI